MHRSIAGIRVLETRRADNAYRAHHRRCQAKLQESAPAMLSMILQAIFTCLNLVLLQHVNNAAAQWRAHQGKIAPASIVASFINATRA